MAALSRVSLRHAGFGLIVGFGLPLLLVLLSRHNAAFPHLPTESGVEIPSSPPRGSGGLSDGFWPSSPRPLWETLDWPTYPPLPDDALERSFVPPATPEASCPWAQAAAALTRNESVSILVIGSSVTKGSGCGDEACRWSRHVGEWLRRVRPQWRVVIDNIASGGMGIGEWADAHIPPGPFDILIVDTSVAGFCYSNSSLRVNADRLLWRIQNLRGAHTGVGGGPPATLFVQVG